MESLKGIRVVEIAGLAPVPFCGQVLADFGADVTVVQKKNSGSLMEQRLVRRKKLISLDFVKELPKLKSLIRDADVLLDPYRPGVLEAIGLDPEELLRLNPGLIIARITGFGQTGPLSQKAGHDINYMALSGAMPLLAGRNRPPWPPANLLADFAGGGLAAAFGVLAALLQRQRTGVGAIVDASMTEGAAYLASQMFSTHENETLWGADHGFFSGNSPIFRTYETKDRKFMAVGALEPKFHNQLFKVLNVDPSTSTNLTAEIEAKFKSKTRAEWEKVFAVLSIAEAIKLPHHVSRNQFEETPFGTLPKAAPRIYSIDEFRKIKSKL